MQVEYKTEQGTLLFVKLPEQNPTDTDLMSKIITPVMGFKLIGLTSEVTEEQAKMMVDKMISSYQDYTDSNVVPTFSLFTALDSFRSLMQHLQVYDINPYDTVNSDGTINPIWLAPKTSKEYNEAESRTGKWILLFKPNQ